MTKQDAKNVLVGKITSLQGVKATQLAAEEDVAIGLADFNIPELLEELVTEKRLIEIEYTLPDMEWRLKSFYLPVGTQLSVKGN